MPNPVQRKQCRHIRTSGQRCGSASLREQTFCFYHQRTRNRPVAAEGVRPQDHTFDVQPLDDRASIQFALFEVLRRIALNQIDCKRAGHLLYGLQIAATVLPPAPRPTSAATPEPAPPAVEDYITHPDLGPIAPEADFVPPTSPAEAAALHRAETDQLLKSLAQPSRRHIPLPDPTLNPTFYSDPARFGYPELVPFLQQARKQAGLPTAPTGSSTTHDQVNVLSGIEPAEALK